MGLRRTGAPDPPFAKLVLEHLQMMWRRTQLYEFQKMREQGKTHRGKTGRKPYISKDKFQAEVKKKSKDGRGLSQEEVGKLTADGKEELWLADPNKPSRNTIQEYWNMVNLTPGMSKRTRVVQKDDDRRTAEVLERRALGYAVAVAVLHEDLHPSCVVNTDDKTLVVADYCGGLECTGCKGPRRTACLKSGLQTRPKACPTSGSKLAWPLVREAAPRPCSS